MDSINDLLKLKRHETPREGYMDDFVKEFHQRQRLAQRESKKSGRFFEGLGHWVHEFNAAKWTYPLGISYALVMMWLLLSPSHDRTIRENSPVPVHYPAPIPAAPVMPSYSNELKKDQPEKAPVVEPF